MAKDLRDQNSSFANDGLVNAYFNYLDEAFFSYFYNDATATSDRATLEVYFATSTAEATIQYLTRTVWAIDKATSLACWKATGKMCTATFTPTETLIPTLTSTVTPSPKPSFTTTHLPSSTPQPPSATSLVSTSTVIQEAGVPGTIIIGAVLVIILVVAGYLFMKNLRQGTS